MQLCWCFQGPSGIWDLKQTPNSWAVLWDNVTNTADIVKKHQCFPLLRFGNDYFSGAESGSAVETADWLNSWNGVFGNHVLKIEHFLCKTLACDCHTALPRNLKCWMCLTSPPAHNLPPQRLWPPQKNPQLEGVQENIDKVELCNVMFCDNRLSKTLYRILLNSLHAKILGS